MLQNALLSFQKLALIEVNESMKLKGSEMGTKMQKIESRSSSFKRENFGKLQQAVGPGDRLQTQLGQLHKLLLLLLLALAVDAAESGLFLSFKVESSVERTFDRGRPPLLADCSCCSAYIGLEVLVVVGGTLLGASCLCDQIDTNCVISKEFYKYIFGFRFLNHSS